MSKHHHYHPSPSGNYSTSAKSSHDANMMVMVHGSNGLRVNGIVNGDIDSNDTNNNHNKHHKRSAGSSAEASSSKRTKLSSPSEKSVAQIRPQSHYNIMEKLKELYKELKGDKGCKEVSSFSLVRFTSNRFNFSCTSRHRRSYSISS